MPKGYSHLTRDQRSQIYALKSRGISQRQIAKQLQVAPSTINREIARNSGQRGYRIEQAQQFAERRRVAASSQPRVFTPELQTTVEHGLLAGWSPEQISGRLKLEQGRSISPERIYQNVWPACFKR
jgi:IS30 family transposase